MTESILERVERSLGPCACGKTHTLKTREVYLGEDMLAHLLPQVRALSRGQEVLLVADPNTYAAQGRQVEQALTALGPVRTCLLGKGEAQGRAAGEKGQGPAANANPAGLHADAGALGQVLLAMPADAALLVAVGSGTINDITRFVAARTGKPYLVVGTAPSMDGYASSVSPVLQDGMKVTYEAVAPQAVLCDTRCLAAAPQRMVAAGLGDLLGKHIALLDWKLSAIATGENHCEKVAGLMRQAVGVCEAAAPGLAAREPAAMGQLADGLILSGLAMQMTGNSRPASGCEHHLSHFWEMRQLLRGQGASLHGDKVGVATLIMIRFYHAFFARKRPVRPVDEAKWVARMRAAYGPLAQGFLELNPLTRQEARPFCQQKAAVEAHWAELAAEADALYARRDALEAMLEEAGGPTRPDQVGCTEQDVRDALLCAFLLRPRFTLLKLAYEWGVLEEIADELC